MGTYDDRQHPREKTMNKALIEKLLMALLSDDSEQPSSQELIGEYVIVRCRDAGVHAGTLQSYSGREVVLTNSRRLWYWKAKSGHTLSAVAEYGITDESKISPAVSKIVLTEACEIIETTDGSGRSIRYAKIHNS